ncbi:MAG: 4-oxalocrotonate tautomerase family protein [Anaerolineae bacterium]
MPTVIVYWSPGRTGQQKADVIRGLTDALVEFGGAHREDVLVIFQDIEPGNAGRGGAVLQSPRLNEPLPPGDETDDAD